jgi:K+-transporting ATPase KdpF subunit
MSPSCFTAAFLHRFYTRLATLAARLFQGGDGVGHPLSRFADRVLRAFRCTGMRLRAAAGKTVMSWLYALSGTIALVLAVYLVIALLFPEKF